MGNPRVTITIRQDLYEGLELVRVGRGISRGRMFEEVIEKYLELVELEDLELRSPVSERLRRLEEMIEELQEVVEERAERLSMEMDVDTEKRIVPRVMEARIASEMVYELLRRTVPAADRQEREDVRHRAVKSMKR